jgi:ATP-binding cassette subfamily F protein 3
MVGQPVGSLSGGEKARLVLAMLVWQRPNLLLLDEPTNHLDLQTREALSMALNEYEGTVLLVSHDRALLREVCDEFWLVTHGKVEPFDGDLDDYQRWLMEQSREAARAARGEPRVAPLPPAPPPPAPGRKPAASTPKAAEDRKARGRQRAQLADRTRPLRSELQQAESRLARLSAERGEIEGRLAAGEVASAEMADAGRQLNHIAAETARLEERWLELSGEIEAMAKGADPFADSF